MRFKVGFVALLLLAMPALAADVGPADSRNLRKGCVAFKLCDDQAATGVCTKGPNNIQASGLAFTNIRFDASESDATTFTAEIYTGLGGTTGNSQQINGSSLSETAYTYFADGPFLGSVWVNVTAIADNTVDVWVTACGE